jgi:hypothetical protein
MMEQNNELAGALGGVIGPNGMTPAAKAYMQQLVKQTVQAAANVQQVDKNAAVRFRKESQGLLLQLLKEKTIAIDPKRGKCAAVVRV